MEKKKPLIAAVLIVAFLIYSLMPLVSAKTSEGFFHSNDYYVITFDGEGDAVVSAKFVIDNFTDENLKQLNFEIPGNAKIFKAVQESIGKKIDFETDFTSEATLLTLTLPEKIEANSTDSIVLLYKISGYAEKDFVGNFNFDFKTVIDRDAALIQNVRVAINASEEFFVKGGTAKVDFKPDFFGSAALSKMSAMEISSTAYRQYSDEITYAQGAIVKNASNLDPFESFHVKGTYSENWFSLYGIEAVLGIIALILAILVIKAYSEHSHPKHP